MKKKNIANIIKIFMIIPLLFSLCNCAQGDINPSNSPKIEEEEELHDTINNSKRDVSYEKKSDVEGNDAMELERGDEPKNIQTVSNNDKATIMGNMSIKNPRKDDNSVSLLKKRKTDMAGVGSTQNCEKRSKNSKSNMELEGPDDPQGNIQITESNKSIISSNQREPMAFEESTYSGIYPRGLTYTEPSLIKDNSDEVEQCVEKSKLKSVDKNPNSSEPSSSDSNSSDNDPRSIEEMLRLEHNVDDAEYLAKKSKTESVDKNPNSSGPSSSDSNSSDNDPRSIEETLRLEHNVDDAEYLVRRRNL